MINDNLENWEHEDDDGRGMTTVLRLVEQNLERGEESSGILDMFVVECNPLFVFWNWKTFYILPLTLHSNEKLKEKVGYS